MAGHRPGPIQFRTTESHVHNEPGRIRTIGKAEIYTSGPKGSEEDLVDEADARLYAASTDLLEACQAIKTEAEDCIGYLLLDKSSAEYRAMLSAIAKATEGQP